jgi:hypothetical protein
VATISRPPTMSRGRCSCGSMSFHP